MKDRTPNWHDDVFFGIHYDLHANKNDTNLGAELTEEHLQERLRLVKPDWIQCDCKGHAGWTSWPTEVGSTSPGVVNDALRIHRDVTKRMGIHLGMHYSGVWDTRAIELHPEWGRINADGSRDTNNTCPLSAYRRELMIPQMLELIDKYDVDGFWVDGENWASAPCYCDACRAEFTARTGLADVPTEPGQGNWDAWLAFHRDLFVAHVTEYAEACHARKPECLICSNWMYTVRQPDPVTAPVDYLSGDYDWIWGADRAAVEGRVLDGRGMTWDLMAWDFLKTRDMRSEQPWTMKPAEHLKQELAEVVALGGAVMCYEKPERSGWLVSWRHEILAEVAEFCRERQIVHKSTSVPEAAVVHLASAYYKHNQPLFNYGGAVEPIEGALHALLETQRSTDILTEDTLLERGEDYKLLVFPEQENLSPAVLQFIKSYVAGGGAVILDGSHLATDFPDLVGARPRAAEGPSAPDPDTSACYLEVNGKAVGVFGDWQAVDCAADTDPLAYKLINEEPSKDTSDRVLITRRRVGEGTITAIHGPLFRNYFAGHYPWLRELFAGLVDELEIDWLVELGATPPQIEMVLREKEGSLLVNLINRGAGEMLMPRRVIAEYIQPVYGIILNAFLDEPPVAVSLVPEDADMTWSYEDGVLTIELDEVDIHSVVVIEPAGADA